jgi:hypothetical protein
VVHGSLATTCFVSIRSALSWSFAFIGPYGFRIRKLNEF